MTNNKMDWVDKGDGRYFKLVEGDNRVQLLSHLARYLLKWNGTKYVPAEEGDTNVSVKGVGWVLQDGAIKDATLPYTVVKAVRELMADPEYAFDEFPMPRQINIRTKNAGVKEAEYTVIPGAKEILVPSEILEELAKRPTPEQLVEMLQSKEKGVSQEKVDYPKSDPRAVPPFDEGGHGESGTYPSGD